MSSLRLALISSSNEHKKTTVAVVSSKKQVGKGKEQNEAKETKPKRLPAKQTRSAVRGQKEEPGFHY